MLVHQRVSGNDYNSAIEDGPVEIVDLPSYKMVMFQLANC